MDVSVVIINYNVKDLILQALKSLYRFTDPSLSCEVIVVDNNSSDGSCEAIAQAFPQVILVRNDFNAGFPAANNQGFRLAKGEYIFMLNPDTEFIEDTIGSLFRFLKEKPHYKLIAPKLLNTDRSHQVNTWRYPSIMSIIGEMFFLPFLARRKNYADQDYEKSFEADSFSGAAIFFHRSVPDNIGMLDEEMFWIEDIDFCYRAKKAGIRTLYFPATSLIHHSGQSAKKNYNISISNQVYNKIKFFRKHYSATGTFIVKCISAFYCITRFMAFSFLSPFGRVWFLKARAYLYTLRRVFNPPAGIQ